MGNPETPARTPDQTAARDGLQMVALAWALVKDMPMAEMRSRLGVRDCWLPLGVCLLKYPTCWYNSIENQ